MLFQRSDAEETGTSKAPEDIPSEHQIRFWRAVFCCWVAGHTLASKAAFFRQTPALLRLLLSVSEECGCVPACCAVLGSEAGQVVGRDAAREQEQLAPLAFTLHAASRRGMRGACQEALGRMGQGGGKIGLQRAW